MKKIKYNKETKSFAVNLLSEFYLILNRQPIITSDNFKYIKSEKFHNSIRYIRNIYPGQTIIAVNYQIKNIKPRRGNGVDIVNELVDQLTNTYIKEVKINQINDLITQLNIYKGILVLFNINDSINNNTDINWILLDTSKIDEKLMI